MKIIKKFIIILLISLNQVRSISYNSHKDAYSYEIFNLDPYKDFISSNLTPAAEKKLNLNYKKLIQKYHPDKLANESEQTKKIATDISKLINQAKDYLKSPDENKNYLTTIEDYKTLLNKFEKSKNKPKEVYDPLKDSYAYEILNLSAKDFILFKDTYHLRVDSQEKLINNYINLRNKFNPNNFKDITKKNIALKVYKTLEEAYNFINIDKNKIFKNYKLDIQALIDLNKIKLELLSLKNSLSFLSKINFK